MMRGPGETFAEAAGHCRNIDDLRSLLEDGARELGFRFFALLHHASLGCRDRHLLRIDNYPAEWVAEIGRRQLWRCDPVHLASGRTAFGFAWSELGRLVTLRPEHRRILRRGRRFGIGPGFTVPVNVPGEPAGSCSFAVGDNRELPRRRLACAQLIGLHAFKAARRLHPIALGRPHLSRREIQCLRLVALGKTDWEIGAILGIHLETARQYVKRAREAYGVATRTQLALLGLRDRWISLDEAGIG